MADGVLGLGSGQAASLNQELIDKLKAAERKAKVEPYETKLEDITSEKEIFATINTKVADLLETIKPFDLFITGGATVFDQKSASTSGDSALFDAADVSVLNKGVTTVDITSLAQKDVYQSNKVDISIKDDVINQGSLDITVNGITQSFDTTSLTYDQLAVQINAKTGMNASFEQVDSNSYRLVIKSEESGLDNALSISGTASQALGYTTDGTIVDSLNHTLTAKNLAIKVDGVDYSVSSNDLSIDGLKITAVKEGISTINIVEDHTQVATLFEDFIAQYNELVDLVDDATNAESTVDNKSGLKSILSQIKDMVFGSYGASNDKSLFSLGLELNTSGKLSLDRTVFDKAVEDDFVSLRSMFIGTAENEGFGTQLKAAIDEMNFSSGLLDLFETSMTKREETLNTEKDKAQEILDLKYKQLAVQFSSYGTIINQMEASFSGLKLLINQSVATN